MKTVDFLILATGIFSLIYYGIIICYAGIGAAFSRFWLLAGISCVILFISIRYMRIRNITLPWPARYGFIGIVLAGICTILFIEGLIIFHAGKKAGPDAEYLIVLGARIRGTKITRSLYMRLKTAEVYLKDNQKTLVIVSGGQGPGEDISEAEVMKKFLLENGIEEKRILTEDKSKNTLE
ncbi:MAG TPA: YdcF family protein, partial [Mobilitalea sp.]|nr:YdcF family protein [Mobilitalea sp.]